MPAMLFPTVQVVEPKDAGEQVEKEEEEEDETVTGMPEIDVDAVLTRTYEAFPSTTPNMQAFGRVNYYHKPSLRGGFVTTRKDDVITATREEDNFCLKIDLRAVLTSKTKSIIDLDDLVDANYPYPDIDNVNRFFIPHDAVNCTIRVNEDRGEVIGLINIECEGYMCLHNNEIRIDAVDFSFHHYFWFSIHPFPSAERTECAPTGSRSG